MLIFLFLMLWPPAQQEIAAQARAAAEEAAKLQQKQTVEALRQALEQYNKALTLWREAGEKREQARASADPARILLTLYGLARSARTGRSQ